MKLTDIRYHERLAERFWAKVDKGPHPGGCWVWTGARDASGYGSIGVAEPRGYRPLRAPRIAYLLTHGAVRDDLDMCHTCDNPLCVNPAHLWQGTRRENLADMDAKGRRRTRWLPRPGERNGMARLTAEQVREIRTRVARGEKQNALAAEYGVPKQTINNVVLRHSWKHLP
jgi:HNH endonuclease